MYAFSDLDEVRHASSTGREAASHTLSWTLIKNRVVRPGILYLTNFPYLLGAGGSRIIIGKFDHMSIRLSDTRSSISAVVVVSNKQVISIIQ